MPGKVVLDVVMPVHWGQRGGEELAGPLATMLGDHPAVTVHGAMTFGEFRQFLDTVDVTVDVFGHSLEREFAMVTRSVVALASGVPVIHPYFTEVTPMIEEFDAGWMVVPGEPSTLAAALDEIIPSPETVQAKAEGARALWRARLEPRKAVRPLVDLIDQSGMTRLYALTPTWKPVGGVIKILDYSRHALDLGYEVILVGPPIEPGLPLFEIERFQPLAPGGSVDHVEPSQFGAEPDDFVFFSWPTDYETVVHRLTPGTVHERVIHIVQNVRHANPSWIGGYALRLLDQAHGQDHGGRGGARGVPPLAKPGIAHRGDTRGTRLGLFLPATPGRSRDSSEGRVHHLEVGRGARGRSGAGGGHPLRVPLHW